MSSCDLPDTYSATAALFSGQFEKAFALAKKALAVKPNAADPLLVLASIALEHGNLPVAQDLASLAEQQNQALGWCSVIRGRIALAQGDSMEARTRARAAAQHGTCNPHVAGQLGVLFSRTGLHDEALEHLARAADHEADNRQYRYNLAIALQFAGQLDAARQHFDALLAQWPDHAPSRLARVQLDRQVDDHALPTLKSLFENAASPDDRLALGHAIAKTLEDLSRWDESLAWLERAKAEKRKVVAHDRTTAEACFKAAAGAALNPGPADGPDDRSPIFIIGLPRSGTTLVERIIASHPAVRSAGELSDFSILLKRQLRTPGPHVLDATTLAVAQNAPLGTIGEDYIRRARTIAGEAPAHFIDKMPFNLFFAPAILRALPEARIICLRRSPYDTLFSNFRQLFATGFSYYSYAYDFDDTAHFIAGFEHLADHYAQTLPPDRFREQHYEALIADQEGETRALLAFLGLEWDDRCLDFHRNQSPVATASSVQVRRPIYADAVARWRRYQTGSARAIEALSAYGLPPPQSER